MEGGPTSLAAQKVAHNRSWDDLDLESTFEHRRENGLIRQKSGSSSQDYEDAEFSGPENIEFDTNDLIDAAVEVFALDSPLEGDGFELSVPGRGIRPFGRGEDAFQ